MRIWLASSSFAPHQGGVEEVTLRLAQQLQRSGDDVLVVTNQWPLDLPDSDLIEGVRVLRIPFQLPAARLASALRYLRTSRRHLRMLERLVRPDVVHVHCASSQLPTMNIFTRRHSIPLVLSTHGETEMDAQGLFQQSHFMRWALRRASRGAAALTACSVWTAAATSSIAPAFASARVILNGVEAKGWPASPLPREPVIAAWGRHVPQKGFDLLLQALPLVREVEPRARLLLGGEGEETARLKQVAGDGVDFLGALNRSDVYALLRRSRVVAVPSRVEPFGLVAVEALAAGRGLVYAKGTGLEEASGGLGSAVDVQDPGALAKAIIEQLRNPTPASEGRAWAATLDWEEVAQRYRAVYPQ